MEPVTTNLFIDGAARPAAGKATYALVNPARPSEVVGHAAAANREDVDAAMQAAQRAFGAWAAMSMAERAAMLTHISGELNADAAETASRARLLTREHGKTLFETNTLFVDARAEEYFENGHIPNAICNDDINLLIEEIDSRIQVDEGFIVYCSDDDCGSSEELAYKLQEQGFMCIYVFKGGWKQWTNNNLPVSR